MCTVWVVSGQSPPTFLYMHFILAVQVIFICIYITNYLHFFTMFLSF